MPAEYAIVTKIVLRSCANRAAMSNSGLVYSSISLAWCFCRPAQQYRRSFMKSIVPMSVAAGVTAFASMLDKIAAPTTTYQPRTLS